MQECTIELSGPPQPVRLHYTRWGPADAERTIMCVHGLTRQGRDFDVLAAALAEGGAQVLCPDMVGRGKSDWLNDPAGYLAPVYIAHVQEMLAKLGIGRVDWVGTSMGGLIGMGLAAMPDGPIRRLVLNDIGPFIPAESLAYIAEYVIRAPRFANLAEAEAYLREIHRGFRDLSDQDWVAATVHGTRPAEGGGVTLAHDPAIGAVFTQDAMVDVDIWPVYDGLTNPTLLLRGADSLLLTAEVADAMTRRGPRAELITFAGVGHAPGLVAPEQVAAVKAFLEAG
ncbi:alpha/beta fold hydrolase [Marinivivus vitaminiproducens]|uniref:alpha/beta fold hydrolase n=1 Tax=Marinivivus vitaminiproducens TaxID=3035935 RepID=UPI0027A7CA7F|nr:alpha/beta hydrolase [Geminicoccaceae bacterium SCSIO 64248]